MHSSLCCPGQKEGCAGPFVQRTVLLRRMGTKVATPLNMLVAAFKPSVWLVQKLQTWQCSRMLSRTAKDSRKPVSFLRFSEGEGESIRNKLRVTFFASDLPQEIHSTIMNRYTHFNMRHIFYLYTRIDTLRVKRYIRHTCIHTYIHPCMHACMHGFFHCNFPGYLLFGRHFGGTAVLLRDCFDFWCASGTICVASEDGEWRFCWTSNRALI